MGAAGPADQGDAVARRPGPSAGGLTAGPKACGGVNCPTAGRGWAATGAWRGCGTPLRAGVGGTAGRSASTSSTSYGRRSAAARSSARSAAAALPAAPTSTSGSAASAVASASAKMRWPSTTRTRIRPIVLPPCSWPDPHRCLTQRTGGRPHGVGIW
ncbi:hypothetical protein KCH_46220 [Kitasatospora cheerisanensis KCTC 2395]|uniref:Uncharacterized protein n=1 Tax=Kitasatospora cheerisanensis KCTC 2395 TaxID=1348663 RepID=A0A066YYY2_9ACTN|nr:hypothetical protein KCH_46220 [Kitasatospora cheerisanensis KCTC 2395]